jgi:excisionase family DNA binding protein
MSYTLGTAAAAVGLNKSTILRAVRSGKISATRTELGTWSIDAAELHRVYPAVRTQQNGQRDAIDETPALIIATLQQTIADLRADRDAWRDQAQRLALPDGRERQGWWRRLRRSA